MANSFPAALKEKKYPFIISVSALVIGFTMLFNKTTTTTSYTGSNFHIRSPKLITSNNHSTITVTTTATTTDLDIEWRLCAVSADYIPCLDNMKAIKALKSRRHMEHRERHCPDSVSPCLVPLPVRYKAPIPWPKSRDMVRMLV